MRKKRDSISFPSYLGLLSESLPLSDGVVQLGVGVANLLRVDEELEPLRYPGDGSVPGNEGNEAAMKRGICFCFRKIVAQRLKEWFKFSSTSLNNKKVRNNI